jgi:autotransporter translocation and assembly factor TamB
MDRAPDFVLAKINALIKGRVSTGSITYNGTDGLILRRVSLFTPAGRLVLSAKRIQVRVGLLDLLKSVVRISAVTIDGLNAQIRQGADGSIDLLQAVALQQPSGSSESSGGGVVIGRLQLNSARFGFRSAAMRLQLSDINIQGDLEALGQFRADLSISAGKSEVRMPAKGTPTTKVQLSGLRIRGLGIGTHTIRISGGKLRFAEGSTLTIGGLLRPSVGRIDMRIAGAIGDSLLGRILPGTKLPPIRGLEVEVHLGGALAEPQIGISASAASVVLPGAAPDLAALRLAAVLKGNLLTISRCDAKALGGAIGLTGKLHLAAPMPFSGDLRLKAIRLAAVHPSLKAIGGQLTARVLLSGPLAMSDERPLSIGLRGRLRGAKLPAIGYQTADLDLLIMQGKSTRILPSQVVIGANTISLQGRVAPSVDLTWRAQLNAPRRLLAALGGKSLPPRLTARGTLRLKPELYLGFRVDSAPYELAGIQIGSLSLLGHLSTRSMHLNYLGGTLDGAPFSGRIILPFDRPKKPIGRIRLRDFPIPSDAGLASLDLASDPDGNWQGSILVKGLRGGALALGDLELGLHYDGSRVELRALDWDGGLGILSGAIGLDLDDLSTDGSLDLFIDKTGLTLLAGDALRGRVKVRVVPKGKLSNPAAQIQIDFTAMTVAGIPVRDGALTLAATSTSIGGIITTRGNGTSRGTVRLSDGFKRLDLQLKVTGFKLDSLPVDLPGLEAYADLDLRLSGPLASPQGEAQIRLRDLAVDDRLVGTGRGRISVQLADGALSGDLDLLGWVRGTVQASLPRMDTIDADLNIDAKGLQWLIPGLAGGGTEIDLAGRAILGLRGGEPTASLVLRSLRIANPGLWQDELENDGDLVVGYGGGRARFERLLLKMGDGRVDLRGWIEPEGDDGRANLRLSSSLPLELLQLVDPGFSLTRGRVAISGTLRGRWRDRALVQVEVEPHPGSSFVHAAYPRQIILSGGSIRLQDQRVTIDDLRVESGGGEIRLGGTLELEKFVPTELDLNLAVNTFLVRFGNQSIEFSSEISATGQINLMGGKIEQELDISNFVFAAHQSGAGPSFADRLGHFASTELDLEITSSADLQIIAGLPLFRIEMRPSIDLRLIGQLSDIGVEGVIEVEEGNGAIIFPEAAFSIDGATVDLSQDPYYLNLDSAWEYVPRRQQNNDLDDVITLKLAIDGPVDRLELKLYAPEYPDLTRPQLLGMLARGQTPDLLIGQNLAEEGGEGSYGDVALRMITGQVFARFERELERVFKDSFQLPLDAAIDLGVDTLRMQGIINVTERFELSGEAEVVFGSDTSDTGDQNQSASNANNDRQSLRGTFVISDALRAEADLRSGYRSDDEGSVLELLLNLHWRLWAR